MTLKKSHLAEIEEFVSAQEEPIERLSVDFSGQESFDRAFLEAMFQESLIESLKALSVDFRCCPNLDQFGFYALLQQIGRYSKELEELNISIGLNKVVDNRFVRTFCEPIMRDFPHLSVLKLDFSLSPSVDPSAMALVGLLLSSSSFTKLKTFELGVGSVHVRPPISTVRITHLLDGLKKFSKSLEIVNLDLSGLVLDEKQRLLFEEFTKKSCPKLKSFKMII